MFVACKKSRNAVNKLIKDTKKNYYSSALNDAVNFNGLYVFFEEYN